jgi:2-isopropylmalate synthase
MLNYDIVDASKKLAIARSLKTYRAPFAIIDNYRLIDNGVEPEATVQIEASGKIIHEASTGNGPVDALAKVLKKGLTPLFPTINGVKLIDFRADILDARRGTSTVVEVTIIFTDGDDVWKVSALSENINYASFNGLIDGFEYAILKQDLSPQAKPRRRGLSAYPHGTRPG